MKNVLLFGLVALILLKCQPPTEVALDAQYMESFEDAQQDLMQRRTNYLKLAGLLPFEAEKHILGTSDSADWVIDATGFPPIIGTFQITPEGIIFTGNPDIRITAANDSLIQTVNLTLDKYGNSLKLTSGQLSWMIITRGVDKLYLRVWDENNSAVQNFTTPERYPLNGQMIFDGHFQYYPEPKSAVVDSKLGFDQPTVFIGSFSFNHEDQTHTL